MKSLLLATGAILIAYSPVGAQSRGDFRIRVGAGAQLKPKFIGADDVRVAPLWDIDVARGTNPFPFEAPDDPFGFAVISAGGFSAGPALNFQSSRRVSDVGAALGGVPTTVEAGAFAEYQIGNAIRLRADVRKGIGGHKGVVGAIGADKIWRDGDRYVFSIGPRLLISDERYQRAYFGVSDQAALASGLPAYRPRGGIHGVALISGLSYQFTPRVGLFGFAQYERLVGDAARSPIVRDLGSRDQLSGGLGLNYTFTVRP